MPSEDMADTAPAKPTRQYYIDWLRVLAILIIFTFHSARFFDSLDWHVKNTVTTTGFSIYITFISSWIMPLFFVLSGASIYYALQSRSTGYFAKERVTRLLVPLVIVGIFILAPPQVYLERLSHGDFSGNFFAFIPEYFKGNYDFGDGNFPVFGLHLWFLLTLFIYSMILLPLFIPNKQTLKSLLSRFSKYFEKWWALLLLALPIFVLELSRYAIGMDQAGWSILVYLLLLAYGYLIFSNTKIQAVIRKYTFAFLGVAIALSILHIILRYVVEVDTSSLSPQNVGIQLERAFNVWLWILAFIGLGMRYLQRNNRFVQYANEAVLPFYILHQTIIVLIGYFIVQWNISIGVKYVLVLIICFPVIMAIYHLLVRRFNVLRFLFGMRLNKKKAET